MRKAIIVALLAIAVLTGGAGAVLNRYDASRSDVIADGVTIGGVDVGGVQEDEARRALTKAVAVPLRQPLALTFGHRRFEVDPGLVHVQLDVDALVERAVAESREGSFLARAFRDLTGGRLDVDVPLRVEYSRDAVSRVVAGVQQALDRPARDAESAASFAGVSITPSRTGVAVRARALRQTIRSRLVQPGSDRTLAVPVRRLTPKVTTRELSERFTYFIAISRGRRELRFFVHRRLAKTYQVGIGQIGFETPAGLYDIKTKSANPAWYVPNEPWAGDLAGKVIPPGDPSNPIKARWMGFWDGAGIHGTAEEDSIGTAASHGCIRMTVPDVIDLYDQVPLHTPVYIS
jgi:lipoprotein-anchoring transpeptidase ErfK/SrfK